MRNLRTLAIVGAVVVALVLALGVTGSALAFGPLGQTQTPGGNVGPGWGCGGWGGNRGYGPGGMMGGWGGNANPAGDPITIQKAEQAVANYVQAGNWQEDLVVDEVMEFQYNFYAIVKEKATGVGAFEVLVDKYTGYVYPEMGPNMMWNTKYGHMGGFGSLMGGYGGMMGGRWGGSGNGWWGPNVQSTPTADMPVTAEQAVAKASEYLAGYAPGVTTETPDTFYGYYTLHTVGEDGEVNGMLSVNGYTGAVWYHTWHGGFIQEIEGGHAE